MNYKLKFLNIYYLILLNYIKIYKNILIRSIIMTQIN